MNLGCYVRKKMLFIQWHFGLTSCFCSTPALNGCLHYQNLANNKYAFVRHMFWKYSLKFSEHKINQFNVMVSQGAFFVTCTHSKCPPATWTRTSGRARAVQCVPAAGGTSFQTGAVMWKLQPGCWLEPRQPAWRHWDRTHQHLGSYPLRLFWYCT